MPSGSSRETGILTSAWKIPKHQNRKREAQFQDTFRGVPEPAVRRQLQEVLEIRRKGSDYNG